MDVNKQNQESKKHTFMDIGALLIEARETKKLTAQDIADQLNLTLSVIQKIEKNEFKQDIPLAFIRGYLRSYAQKVAADVETLSVEFDRQTNVADDPVQKIKVVSSFKTSGREFNSSYLSFKLVTYFIVISLLAFGGWEMWKRFGAKKMAFQNIEEPQINQIQLNTQTLGAATETDNNKELLSDNKLVDMASNQVASEMNRALSEGITNDAETGERNNLANNLANTESQTQAPQAISAVNQALDSGLMIKTEFVFSADCWVKVTDANGDVLAVGVKRNGKVMLLSGLAPLLVILGNPAAVNLTVEGEDYDLSVFRPGKRARFSLTALNQ